MKKEKQIRWISIFVYLLYGLFIIINKNDQEEKISLEPSILNMSEFYERQSYIGDGPYDDAPGLSNWDEHQVINGQLEVNHDPVSLSVIRLKSPD